jgi:branched-chain amino acid aminotransferase
MFFSPDPMEAYISLDGAIQPANAPALLAGNRLFRYGDGFFEAIRVCHGHILWEDRHYQRILRSAGMLGLELPPGFSRETFAAAINALYRENHPTGEAARVRMAFFRKDGGLYTPATDKSSYLVETSPLGSHDFSLNHKGLMVGLYPELRKSQDFLAGIKSSSALLYVLAGRYKASRGWGDCILLNQEGNVAEALSSNLFIMKNNELITPALDQGCVNGVMRSVVLDIAAELRIKTHEAILEPSDLLAAEEFFLTNTIQGIAWVGGFQKKRYYNKTAPHILQAVNQKAQEGTP